MDVAGLAIGFLAANAFYKFILSYYPMAAGFASLEGAIRSAVHPTLDAYEHHVVPSGDDTFIDHKIQII